MMHRDIIKALNKKILLYEEQVQDLVSHNNRNEIFKVMLFYKKRMCHL